MDINDLRSLVTVVAFLMFCGIVWWAWSDRRAQDFSEAARLPLEDDFPLQMSPSGSEQTDVTVNKGHRP